MQTFDAIPTKTSLSSPAVANNALLIENLHALLRLRQRLNTYVDTQVDDGTVTEAARIAISALIDTVQARALAIELGYSPIPLQTLRSAIEAGHIAGARKRSRSGRAKKPEGGRWEFPRQAFVDWLQEPPRQQNGHPSLALPPTPAPPPHAHTGGAQRTLADPTPHTLSLIGHNGIHISQRCWSIKENRPTVLVFSSGSLAFDRQRRPLPGRVQATRTLENH